MAVMVVGAHGMLGQAVVRAATEWGVACVPMTHRDLDITMPVDVAEAIKNHRPRAVINCAGVVPVPYADRQDVLEKLSMQEWMLAVNGYGPHVLAHACARAGVNFVHVSTDCVFGKRPRGSVATEHDQPRPEDLYGHSKAYGEGWLGMAPFHHPAWGMVVRTSFVGQLGTRGLVAEMQRHRGPMPGWQNVLWSGSTSRTVAYRLLSLATEQEVPVGNPGGIVHLATKKPITKLQVVEQINAALGLGLQVEPVERPDYSRALGMYRVGALTGFNVALHAHGEWW